MHLTHTAILTVLIGSWALAATAHAQDDNFNVNVRPGTAGTPTQPERADAEGRGRARTAPRFEGSQTLPPGAIVVDPEQPEPAINIGRRANRGPIIGSEELLNDLGELDRPLSEEEITAYAATVQQAIPLRPELVQDLRRRLNDVARAQSTPATGTRPEALIGSVRVSLTGTTTPVELYTAPNQVSVLSFFDRTGQRWPVAAYVIGNESAYQVYPMQEGSNQLAVSQLSSHGYTNLIVSLVATDQPLVIDLSTNETQAHQRLDVTVNSAGPNARIQPVVSKAPDMRSSDGIAMSFVQGAPIPPDARELRSDDPDVEAYRLGDRMYVRTSQLLISPAYEQAISGPGGITAYRLKPAPIVMISRDGAITRVRLQ